MSIARRLAVLFKSKTAAWLGRAEDPREILDYSYERQLEMLTKVRRGVADVATSRRRIEIQLDELRHAADRLHEQAGQAVRLQQEDLAREALTRRAAVLRQIDDLQPQWNSLRTEEDKLTVAARRLQSKVESFRTRKETIKATYTAAEAQTRINEAVSGISEEMGDVGMAMQRAEDRSAQMRARAQALDELLASGTLTDATTAIGPRDDIEAALASARGEPGVERELAALKGAVGAPDRPALDQATGAPGPGGRANTREEQERHP